MNVKQVRALERLMSHPVPPLYEGDTEVYELYASPVEVAQGYDDGNTYVVRLWTTTSGHRFPDPYYYLRSDGVTYVYDSETDTCHEVLRAAWTPRMVPCGGGRMSPFGSNFTAERASAPLPDIELYAVKREIEKAIQKTLEETVIGQPLTQRSVDEMVAATNAMVQQRMPEGKIGRLRNPRMEGNALVADGIEIEDAPSS